MRNIIIKIAFLIGLDLSTTVEMTGLDNKITGHPEQSASAVEWGSILLYKNWISPLRYTTVEITIGVGRNDWITISSCLAKHNEIVK